MHVRAAVLALAGSLALVSGCSLKAPAMNVAPVPSEGVVGTTRQLTSFRGVALAPASLIATNGSTLISDKASGLISDKAAAYALLAVEDLKAVPNAEVEIQDAAGNRVAGVEKVKTDAKGEFTLKNVPAGVNWVVEVKTTGLRLTTIVRPTLASAGKPVSVDPATTAVTEHLRKAFGQEKRALRQVQPADFEKLAKTVKDKLDKGELNVDLKPGGKAAEVLELVASQDGGIGQEVKAIVQTAQAAQAEAKAKGQDTDDAAPVTPTQGKPDAPPSQKPEDVGSGDKGGDKAPDDKGQPAAPGDKAPNR